MQSSRVSATAKPAVSTLVSGVTEAMLQSVREMLLQRVAALEGTFRSELGQAGEQLARLGEASSRHDQAYAELQAGQGRLRVALKQSSDDAGQATAALVSALEAREAQLLRLEGQQRELLNGLEASVGAVAQLQHAMALCAKEAETRARFDGAAKDLQQLQADVEQDFASVREVRARTEALFRGLVADVTATHTHAEGELRAELRASARQATLAWEELRSRDDAISRELEHAEAAIRELARESEGRRCGAGHRAGGGAGWGDADGRDPQQDASAQGLRQAPVRMTDLVHREALSQDMDRREAALRAVLDDVGARQALAEENLKGVAQRADRAQVEAARARAELPFVELELQMIAEHSRGMLGDVGARQARAEEDLKDVAQRADRAQVEAARAGAELSRVEVELRGALSETSAEHKAWGELHLRREQGAPREPPNDEFRKGIENTVDALRGLLRETNAAQALAHRELRASEAETPQSSEELASRSAALSESPQALEVGVVPG